MKPASRAVSVIAYLHSRTLQAAGIFSDSGGYAQLIAAAQWLLYLDGKNDWEVHRVPALAVK